MGYGSYTATDWGKLKASRKITDSSTEQVFKAQSCSPKYDPRFIGNREARDSEDHPYSTPIAIGVDVTGSMGYLSAQIIKESLNDLMLQLYSTDIVSDPQLMFAAIGDALVDNSPLQVTHFESDIRIAEQLLDLWLENRGGDLPEDYELMWYFLAKHTDIDCFNKRGKKGFCFTIGDAPCHDELTNASISRIFGDKALTPYTSEELANMAMQKYEVFHIVIGQHNHNFETIIPGRIILIEKTDVTYLADIIIAVMQYVKGLSRDTILSGKVELVRSLLTNVLDSLCIENNGEINF